jgi:hypothetical protein
MNKCSYCKELELIVDNSYMGKEPRFGGNMYRCKKGYFTLDHNPFQPQECIDGKPPRNPWKDVKVHKLTEDEMNKIHESAAIARSIKNIKHDR